jgi:hypothetical protein
MKEIMEILRTMQAELQATSPEMKAELIAKWDAAAHRVMAKWDKDKECIQNFSMER